MNGEISTVIIFVTTIATVHKFIDIICDKCPKNNKYSIEFELSCL